jgi:hypothetical protein
MMFVDRLKGTLVAILLLVICFPIAVVLTIATSPLWLWAESQFKIEAYGHSGPAEWCYLATYIFLVILVTIIWSKVGAKRVEQREK